MVAPFPAFDSDHLQLPHVKLSLDVGSFVRLYNSHIVRILQHKQNEKNINQKLVLILNFDAVAESALELTAKHNSPHWIDAINIDLVVFVLF